MVGFGLALMLMTTARQASIEWATPQKSRKYCRMLHKVSIVNLLQFSLFFPQ
jgi:hypothetical protein